MVDSGVQAAVWITHPAARSNAKPRAALTLALPAVIDGGRGAGAVATVQYTVGLSGCLADSQQAQAHGMAGGRCARVGTSADRRLADSPMCR